MEEAVDTLFKVDESTAVGELYDLALEDLTDGISLFDCILGVLSKLLETKADSLLVEVITEDLSLDYIADAEDFLRVGDLLGP